MLSECMYQTHVENKIDLKGWFASFHHAVFPSPHAGPLDRQALLLPGLCGPGPVRHLLPGRQPLAAHVRCQRRADRTRCSRTPCCHDAHSNRLAPFCKGPVTATQGSGTVIQHTLTIIRGYSATSNRHATFFSRHVTAPGRTATAPGSPTTPALLSRRAAAIS